MGSTGVSGFNMRFMSVIGIDLGVDYNGIELPNEITTNLMGLGNIVPGLHYFQFSSLQPYEFDYLSGIVIVMILIH
jgi:hypothetical protein